MGSNPQKLELTWFNKDKALIPTAEGKYGYTWVEPKDPRYCETHTLVIDRVVRAEQSSKEVLSTYTERADFQPTDDNLLILGESGDVLEALTRVPELAKKYLGAVKCIYIDPPFNTEKTFEDYEDNLEHSIWLTMMRDRLVHLRKLLSEDGSIWVHLDDSENHRMRLLLDEVFGAGNFVSEVAWEKKDSPKMDDQGVSTTHDSILVFRKGTAWSPNRFGVLANESDFPKVDPDGRRYSTRELRKWGKNSLRRERPNGWYPITAPNGTAVYPIRPDGKEGTWRWQPSLVEENYDQLEWLSMPEPVGLTPYVKSYMDAGKKPLPPKSIWLGKEVGGNPVGKNEVKSLFPEEDPFSTPKPERLLERIIHIASDPGDIVLDVFAGSGTTAAVAQKMGRRWVTCELIEETFNRFTLSRLMKVIKDEDSGGITLTRELAPKEDLEVPDKNTADDFKESATLIGRILTQEGLQEEAIGAFKYVKAMLATKKVGEINWRGGGGFSVGRLSPACFDYDPALDIVMLTDEATGQTLIDSVAANLNFRRTPEHRHFHGARGAMRLAVIEGRLDREKVDDLVAHLHDDGLTIAATEIDDGVRQYLRSLGRGCRAVHIPNDIFAYAADKDN